MNKNNRLFLAENLNKPLDENLEFSLDRNRDITCENIRGEITRANDTRDADSRGDEKSKKSNKPKKPKKLKFKDYKKNTINSLNEVEFFLNNLDKAFKCVHIFKILR